MLAEYQCDARSGWANREYCQWLYAWASEFIRFYELQTRGGYYMAVPVMKIVPRSVRTIVSYRAKRDGLGLAGTIEVNENLLKGNIVTKETLLAHLLKALVRAWERERSRDEIFVREGANRQRIVQSGWFSFRHRITALNVCGYEVTGPLRACLWRLLPSVV